MSNYWLNHSINLDIPFLYCRQSHILTYVVDLNIRISWLDLSQFHLLIFSTVTNPKILPQFAMAPSQAYKRLRVWGIAKSRFYEDVGGWTRRAWGRHKLYAKAHIFTCESGYILCQELVSRLGNVGQFLSDGLDEELQLIVFFSLACVDMSQRGFLVVEDCHVWLNQDRPARWKWPELFSRILWNSSF
jgi:hypothetical protein